MSRPELIYTRVSQAVDEAEDAAASPSSLGGRGIMTACAGITPSMCAAQALTQR